MISKKRIHPSLALCLSVICLVTSLFALSLTFIITSSPTLLLASRSADLTEMIELIRRGYDVNESGLFGETALMYVAKHNNREAAAILLKYGAHIDQENAFGDTALMEAAYLGHKNMVQFLISQGAKLDVKDHAGRTALMEAAWQGHTSIVRYLYENGANSRLRSDLNFTALDYAQNENHQEIIDYLSSRERPVILERHLFRNSEAAATQD